MPTPSVVEVGQPRSEQKPPGACRPPTLLEAMIAKTVPPPIVDAVKLPTLPTKD